MSGCVRENIGLQASMCMCASMCAVKYKDGILIHIKPVREKIQIILPVFLEAINISLMIELKSKIFKILVQVLSEYVLQTITGKGKGGK